MEHIAAWNSYINLTTNGAIYPTQHFPFGAAFVCQAGNFLTLPRIIYNDVHQELVNLILC
jgi:hypothetical protein